MPIETGWLIEIGQTELLYLSGFSITDGVGTTFSPNASEALRFARAQDAEYVAGQVLDAEVGCASPNINGDPRAGPDQSEEFGRTRSAAKRAAPNDPSIVEYGVRWLRLERLSF